MACSRANFISAIILFLHLLILLYLFISFQVLRRSEAKNGIDPSHFDI
jgi:hypothetical protein